MTVDNAIIYSLITFLGGVIGFMWQKMSKDHDLLVARADACESDRHKMHALIAELTGDSELLARCPAPRCPMRDDAPRKETTKIFPRPRAA